jgi:hypothetical protein
MDRDWRRKNNRFKKGVDKLMSESESEEKKSDYRLIVRSTLKSHKDDVFPKVKISDINLGEDSIEVYKNGKKEYSFAWDYIDAISIIKNQYRMKIKERIEGKGEPIF